MSSAASSASAASSPARSGSPASSNSSRSPSPSGSVASVASAASAASAASRGSRGSRSSSPVSSSSRASSRSPSPEAKVKLKVKIKDRKAAKKSASEDEAASSASEDEETLPPVKRTRPAPRAARTAPAPKSAPEEGEVSDEPVEDDSDKEFDDGLDDDLIGDDEDRALLERMTEREREQELFKRAEIRENLRKKFEIKKRLKQQHKLKGGAEKKPLSSDVSDDDFDTNQMLDAKERSQDRKRNLEAQKFDKKSNALSELKAIKEERQRKEKEKEKRREQANKGNSGADTSDAERGRSSDKRKVRRSSSSSSEAGSYRRRSSSSSSSSPSRSRSRSSSSSGSDTERFRKTSKVEKFVETMEDLEPIRLSRFKIERFLYMPHFRHLIHGCFVRIGIGNNPTGQSVYRCTEVIDVVETAKVYQLGKARTNQGLKLKFGQQERVFRIQFISNSALTPTEFEKWKYTCHDNNISLPTKEFVQTKAHEIRKAMNYEYSSADVDAMIEKKEKFSKNPVNYAMKKAELMKEKEIAMGEHDNTRASELELELKELEEQAEKLNKRRNHNTKFNSISFINDRNRKNNVWKAEEAIKQEIQRKKEIGVEVNPFTRRKCNPRMVTKGQGNLAPDLLDDLTEEERSEKENQVKLEKKLELEKKRKADENEANQAKRKKTAEGKEDIFDAHDFDIEIDVGFDSAMAARPVATPMAVGSPKTVASATKVSGPAKRSLNLADYKKKRGLI
eukprot:snap_masked-scaffold198_size266703-processed-gene-1.5 protein:Tk12350 transcript:snap_masked-scaffold198_size266703-processed-gene-1.5-mRNA-1 annotation:"rna polymerase-associated protein rtf1"